jgi:magnesium-transporting ATPase (P-type)
MSVLVAPAKNKGSGGSSSGSASNRLLVKGAPDVLLQRCTKVRNKLDRTDAWHGHPLRGVLERLFLF